MVTDYNYDVVFIEKKILQYIGCIEVKMCIPRMRIYIKSIILYMKKYDTLQNYLFIEHPSIHLYECK